MASYYLFLVVPHAQTFEALVGMLALPYLGIGLLISRPGFQLIAMLLSVNTASFANIQSIYDANLLGAFNTSLANAVAMLFAPLWATLARPFGAHVAAHRLIRASWQDLAQAATWRGDPAPLGARMLDRFGQLMPRLGASADRLASDGFTELQVGYCTLTLQRALPTLPAPARKPVRRVLSGVARHYRGGSGPARRCRRRPGLPTRSTRCARLHRRTHTNRNRDAGGAQRAGGAAGYAAGSTILRQCLQQVLRAPFREPASS